MHKSQKTGGFTEFYPTISISPPLYNMQIASAISSSPLSARASLLRGTGKKMRKRTFVNGGAIEINAFSTGLKSAACHSCCTAP
jgi:hypothetical protein